MSTKAKVLLLYLRIFGLVIAQRPVQSMLLFLLILCLNLSEALGLWVLVPLTQALVAPEFLGASVISELQFLQAMPDSQRLLFIVLLGTLAFSLKYFFRFVGTAFMTFYVAGLRVRWQTFFLKHPEVFSAHEIDEAKAPISPVNLFFNEALIASRAVREVFALLTQSLFLIFTIVLCILVDENYGYYSIFLCLGCLIVAWVPANRRSLSLGAKRYEKSNAAVTGIIDDLNSSRLAAQEASEKFKSKAQVESLLSNKLKYTLISFSIQRGLEVFFVLGVCGVLLIFHKSDISETNVGAIAPVFVFFAASFQRLIVSSARLIGVAMNLNNLMPALMKVVTLTDHSARNLDLRLASGSVTNAKR